MRNPAISAPRLAGRTDITEATHGQPVHGPASCHPPPHLTRWRAVTGAASKGVLPAALTATKPGCRPRAGRSTACTPAACAATTGATGSPELTLPASDCLHVTNGASDRRFGLVVRIRNAPAE